LIQWLSELAFYAEVRCEIFDYFDIRKISPTYLEAKITGRRFVSLPTPIKAVTYHNLKIIDTDKGLEATIVFDI
jgi:SHS2 domain-containing protein